MTDYTALMYACRFGYVDIVAILLESFCSFSRDDEHNNKALIYACSVDGNVDIVRLLLATRVTLV